MKIVKGDLLKLAEAGEFNIIVQGCNCFNTMGSGLAKQIREQYPLSYEADCRTHRGDYTKLGNYTFSVIPDKCIIVNAYTQYGFNSDGTNKDVFEYTSFAMILQKLAHEFPDARFGFPLIGMGLAGGDKIRIMAMLEEFSNTMTASGGSVTIVEFSQ